MTLGGCPHPPGPTTGGEPPPVPRGMPSPPFRSSSGGSGPPFGSHDPRGGCSGPSLTPSGLRPSGARGEVPTRTKPQAVARSSTPYSRSEKRVVNPGESRGSPSTHASRWDGHLEAFSASPPSATDRHCQVKQPGDRRLATGVPLVLTRRTGRMEMVGRIKLTCLTTV